MVQMQNLVFNKLMLGLTQTFAATRFAQHIESLQMTRLGLRAEYCYLRCRCTWSIDPPGAPILDVHERIHALEWNFYTKSAISRPLLIGEAYHSKYGRNGAGRVIEWKCVAIPVSFSLCIYANLL
jgi:hypothetical protein